MPIVENSLEFWRSIFPILKTFIFGKFLDPVHQVPKLITTLPNNIFGLMQMFEKP